MVGVDVGNHSIIKTIFKVIIIQGDLKMFWRNFSQFQEMEGYTAYSLSEDS
jgi:hypothetical protein